MTDKYILKIYRGTPKNQYWEEFELDLVPSANVISALMDIRENPINKKGERVTPVAWEDGCLEEVCGSCSMLINGVPCQACTALIEPILKETKKRVITIAPMTKFPLIRDLMVDRSIMFENLKKIQGWISADGSYDRGPGPKISQGKQQVMYVLSTCMTCGCCSEACPQINNISRFIGPAAIAQARLFNAHPTGKMEQKNRLQALMDDGGVSDCGNAQNCERVCPKKLPLLESIASIGRGVVVQAAKNLFSLPDREDV